MDIKNNAISGAAPQNAFGVGSVMVFPRGEFAECFGERQIILYILYSVQVKPENFVRLVIMALKTRSGHFIAAG